MKTFAQFINESLTTNYSPEFKQFLDLMKNDDWEIKNTKMEGGIVLSKVIYSEIADEDVHYGIWPEQMYCDENGTFYLIAATNSPVESGTYNAFYGYVMADSIEELAMNAASVEDEEAWIEDEPEVSIEDGGVEIFFNGIE